MVTYVTNNIGEAHIIVGRLQHEGIPAMIDHMAGMSALGITLGRWGEVRILVHPENYDLAQAILFPDEPDELPENTEDPDTIIYPEDYPEDNEDDNRK